MVQIVCGASMLYYNTFMYISGRYVHQGWLAVMDERIATCSLWEY